MNTDKIKAHFKKYKAAYIAGGLGLAAGYLMANKAYQINYKSEGATNIYVEAPKRNMHPGYVVRDTETRMTYPSIRAAAKSTGVDRNLIPGSERFEILGEALA